MSRRELEEQWRKRLDLSKLRLDIATSLAKDIQLAFRLVVHPPEGGVFAVRQAIQDENEALAEYVKVLETFTALILSGAIPEEPEITPEDTKRALD